MFPSPTQNSRISFVSYSKANVPVTDLFLTWTLVTKAFLLLLLSKCCMDLFVSFSENK